jgi:hypothetical protein
MNCAAWLAFWLWALGRTDGVWKRVRYSAGEA